MFGARTTRPGAPAYPDEPPTVVERPASDPALAARLRDEADPDPVVEEAAQRLRDTLSRLDAADEWGRPVAWHLVARIALGAVLPEVSRLLGRLPAGAGEDDLLEAARVEVEWERSAMAQPGPGHAGWHDPLTSPATGVGWPA
jgi:hypothetical protein